MEKEKEEEKKPKEKKKKRKKTFIEALKLIAFGTPLRTAIEKIRESHEGALIVLYSPIIPKIIRGGFRVNCKFTPAKLAELAKMDGAIILDDKLKRIMYASVLLVPDPNIPTQETGTRHQAAERTAKQTGQLTIAISEKSKVVSIYFSEIKYVLKNMNDLVSRTKTAIETIEKQKIIYNKLLNNLNILEFTNLVTLRDVIIFLQKAEMILRVENTIKKYIVELGIEGQILELQLKELTKGIEKEFTNVLKDYRKGGSIKKIKRLIRNLDYNHLLEPQSIGKILLYDDLDITVSPRGYRVLSKIPILKEQDIKNIIKANGNLKNILLCSTESFIKIKGVGRKKASKIKTELSKLKEEAMLSRNI